MASTGPSLDYDFQRRSQPNSDAFNQRWDDINRRLNQLEGFMPSWEDAITGLSNDVVSRIDQVITPIAQTLQTTAELGFLTASSTDTKTLHVGDTVTFNLTQNAQTTSFRPSSFLVLERLATPNDYAICQLLSYDRTNFILNVLVLTIGGDPGPHNDWTITDAPGVSQAVRTMYNSVTAANADIIARQSDVTAKQADVTTKSATASGAAASALTSSQSAQASATATANAVAALQPASFVKRDGSQGMSAVLAGVAPPDADNTNNLVTSAWVRARIAEIIASAPAALDTLKELADAIGDDANFAGTVTAALAQRLRVDTLVTYSPTQLPNLANAISQISQIDNLGTITGTYAVDFSNGKLTKLLTLGGNITLSAPTNLPNGSCFTVFVLQGAGSNTISWASAWVFGASGTPVLSTAAGTVDIITGIVRNGTAIATLFSKGPF